MKMSIYFCKFYGLYWDLGVSRCPHVTLQCISFEKYHFNFSPLQSSFIPCFWQQFSFKNIFPTRQCLATLLLYKLLLWDVLQAIKIPLLMIRHSSSNMAQILLPHFQGPAHHFEESQVTRFYSNLMNVEMFDIQ